LNNAGTSTQSSQVNDGGGIDPLAQLERPSSLRDKGIVSSEEFELEMAELLNRL